jgi:hypothetical protein
LKIQKLRVSKDLFGPKRFRKQSEILLKFLTKTNFSRPQPMYQVIMIEFMQVLFSETEISGCLKIYAAQLKIFM